MDMTVKVKRPDSVYIDNIPQFSDDEDAALNFYRENGYHIERNTFTHDECDAIISAAKNFENPGKGIFGPLMMPHRENDIFLKAIKNERVTNIMSLLVSGKVNGLQSEFFFCAPGTRGFSKHQDNFYVEAGDEVFASAWTALTDIWEEKGSLIAYPGTHKLGKLPVRKLEMDKDEKQDPHANDQETVVPEGYKSYNAVVPKGATFFIHGNIVHASNSNTTNEFRYVLLKTYIKEGEKFRPGNFAKRQAISLE